MIQLDRRIGGYTKYILTDKVIPLMLIPNEVRKCVVFVGIKTHDGKYLETGTAFFLTRYAAEYSPGFTYLVTAKHVLDEIAKINIQKPIEIWLRIKFRDGMTRWMATLHDQWVFHPSDETVDVAVLGVSNFLEYDHFCYPLHICLSPDDLAGMDIDVGHEVFITGLFSRHVGKDSMIPVVRVGNIAAMPEERVPTKFGMVEAYLIEARSTGGLSGSPVFVSLEYSQRLSKRFNALAEHYRARKEGEVNFGNEPSH